MIPRLSVIVGFSDGSMFVEVYITLANVKKSASPEPFGEGC